MVSGDYCECDNFSCDRYNGELCSGPDHGECVCGKCKCNSEWEVEGYTACECKASNETCITPFGEHINKLCSGHGECECGECRCKETEEGQYSGKWCEECPTCPGKCEELKSCVQCQVFQSGELMRTDDGMGGYICTDETGEPKCEFNSIVVPKAEDMVNADERTCTFIDDDDCRFTFVYGYKNETGELQVRIVKDLAVDSLLLVFFAGVGSGDERMPRGGRHHGHRPRRDRGHRGHRSCPHPHVESVHQHPRQAGVCQVREGEDVGQVGHRREPNLQASNVDV